MTRERLLCAVICAGAVLRIVYLDADPHYRQWTGYVTDEGRWVSQARNLALHGALGDSGEDDLHLLFAPVFQLGSYVIFEVAGVDRLTARILPSICGLATLALLWIGLRRVASPLGTATALVLFAFQEDFFVLSRIAIPELPIVMMQLAVFLVIVGLPTTRRQMFAAGMLLTIGVGFKATIAFFVPTALSVILLLPRGSEDAGQRIGRWKSMLWFLTGLAALPALAVVALLIFRFEEFTGRSMQLWAYYWPLLSGFLGAADVYRIASFPFASPVASTLGVMGSGVWLTVLAYIGARGTSIDLSLRRYLTGACVWGITYGAIMIGIAYFPGRYQIQIAIPMIIAIATGVTLLKMVEFRQILKGILAGSGIAHALALGLLALPGALLSASLCAWVINAVGIDATRISVRWAVLCIAFPLTALGLNTWKNSNTIIGAAVILPVLAAIGWMVLQTCGSDVTMWPNNDVDSGARVWVGIVIICILASLVLAGRGWTAQRCFVENGVLVFLFAYMAMFAVRMAPAYVDPYYTLRNVSQRLGLILEDAESIATIGAEGLFIDNDLRYFDVPRNGKGMQNAEVLVVAFDHGRSDWIRRDGEYRLIESHQIYVSPEYQESRHRKGVDDSASVDVYRRVQPD